jgi:cytochrome P450
MARTAREDIVFGGRLIKAGEPIALVPELAPELAGTAARWVRAWRAPDREVAGETSDRMYGIARGTPYRGFARTVRREIELHGRRIALEELLRRTSAIEVSGPVESARMPEIGAVSVPLRLRPA